jgi:hypothetical protein
MARKIAEIQKQILDQVAADDVLGPLLTSTSKRAIYVLWSFVTATAIAFFEQVLDFFTADIEAKIAAGSPSSRAWIQDMMFKFQYSVDVPQVIQLINFAPQYPIVDETLRIITRASVTSDLANSVIVKLAKGETTPEALDAPQLAAAQSYLNVIGAAGISYVARSENPDKLYVNATVFYTGLYSAVIKDNVITAIRNYLAALPFDGNVKISDIELAIRGVVGVNDVILQNIKARSDSMAFADGQYLVLNNATVGRLWPTQAGYIVEETTVGETFADSLVFIPE